MQRFPGTRVFVTGATGFIGGALTTALLKEGATVTALVRRPERAARLKEQGVRIVPGDVTDPASLDLTDQDLVVHAAAWVAFGIPPGKRERYRATNVGGTTNVMEAARRFDVPKVVHYSSIAALARAAMPNDRPATEADFVAAPANFTSLYEETKVAAHQAAAESGLHVTMPMPGVVLGAGGPFEFIFKRFAAGTLRALPRGDAVKAWVHIDDVVEGTLLAALKGEGPYLMVEDMLTVTELLSRLGHSVDVKPPKRRLRIGTLKLATSAVQSAYHVFGKVPPVSPETIRNLGWATRYDASRAKKELGWRPDMWPALTREVAALKPLTKEQKEAAARAAKAEKAQRKAAKRSS